MIAVDIIVVQRHASLQVKVKVGAIAGVLAGVVDALAGFRWFIKQARRWVRLD
jgi:hypothetical protein